MQIRHLLLFIFLGVMCSSLLNEELLAQSFERSWLKTIKNGSTKLCKSVVSDKNGNIYIAGDIEAYNVDFGDTIINSLGIRSLFIAKYSTDGKLKWVKQAGRRGALHCASMVIDHDENLIVTGDLDELSIFGDTTVECNASIGTFIAKYTKEGGLLWVKIVGALEQFIPMDLSVDFDNNIYVYGRCLDSLTFADKSVNTLHNEQHYIAKFNKEGGEKWIRLFDGKANVRKHCLTADTSNNIYFTCSVYDTSQFADTTLYLDESEDILLVKLDSSGDRKWLHTYSSSQDDDISALLIDSTNRLISCGSICYPNDLDTNDTVVKWRRFVGVHSTEGELLSYTPYSQSFGFFSSVVDTENILYSHIYFENDDKYGMDSLIDKGVAVIKFDKQHTISSAYKYSPVLDFPMYGDFTVDRDHSVIVVGNYGGNTDIADSILIAERSDIFIVKLDDKTSTSIRNPLTYRSSDIITIRSVFPNPASGKINCTVLSSQNTNASVTISDVNGKQIMTLPQRFSTGENDLEISTDILPSGMYCLRLRIGSEMRMAKFVKE